MAESGSQAQTFLDAFVKPLITGDEVEIGLPISRETFEELAAEIDAGASERTIDVELALERRARQLLEQPPYLRFDLDGLRIAIAIHQLLFSFHAGTERGRISEKRLILSTRLFSSLTLVYPNMMISPFTML